MKQGSAKFILAALPMALILRDALAGSFTSRNLASMSAVATVGGSLTIQAAPLPAQAFFGKNLVMPVKLTSGSGPIQPENLTVSLVYQLAGPGGIPLTAPTSVLIPLAADQGGPNILVGKAIVQASDLAPIQGGGRVQ